MLVVATIGLLSALALPAFLKSRRAVQNTRFINDLRIASDAIEQYALIEGVFPPDAATAIVPAGMEEYLIKMNWADPTPLGGQWDWDTGTIGLDEGVSIIGYADDARMLEIDEDIDDNDLITGLFQKRGDAKGYIFLTGN